MKEVLEEIRAGRFSDVLLDEEASGYPRLREARDRAISLRVEQARKKLLD
jgi:ketol-acid reductoisomerase